jgi:hypothetical protein
MVPAPAELQTELRQVSAELRQVYGAIQPLQSEVNVMRTKIAMTHKTKEPIRVNFDGERAVVAYVRETAAQRREIFPRLDQSNKKLRPLLERRKRLTAIRKLIEKQIAGDE